MDYIKSNVNPSERKKSDCVVRAIAEATDKPWLEVYDNLCAVGRELFEMPNAKSVYGVYLERLGWTKQRMPKTEQGTRYTVKMLADEKNGDTLVISIARHLTVIKDGNLLDTWDCGYKCVGNYWSK